MLSDSAAGVLQCNEHKYTHTHTQTQTHTHTHTHTHNSASKKGSGNIMTSAATFNYHKLNIRDCDEL